MTPPADEQPETSAAAEATESEAPRTQQLTLREFLVVAQRTQRSGQLEEAEAMYLQVLQQVPDEPNTLNFLGVLRHQQGRNEEALALLERAIECAPDEPGPWINLANVLIEHGLHEDAIKALHNVAILAPDAVMPHNNLGVLHTRRGEWAEAERALKRALELGPNLSYVHYNMGRVCFNTGRHKECIEHNARSITLSGDKSKARQLLTQALYSLGDHEAALQNLRDWQAEDPDNPEAAHHLAAMGITETPARASDAYVCKLFDGFAASFDSQLEKLGYRGPELVCEELTRLRPLLPEQPVVLDAGCGTGLCAPLLRPLAARLEGVDLSGGMLQRAATRGGYDELHQAELTDFFAGRPAAYDAIASADVFIYFGDLDPLIGSLAGSLRPGGALVATVEVMADEADARGYRLEQHGRYAHTAAYLCGVLARHGLRLQRLERHVVRRELAVPVHGWLFSAVRPA